MANKIVPQSQHLHPHVQKFVQVPSRVFLHFAGINSCEDGFG